MLFKTRTSYSVSINVLRPGDFYVWHQTLMTWNWLASETHNVSFFRLNQRPQAGDVNGRPGDITVGLVAP